MSGLAEAGIDRFVVVVGYLSNDVGKAAQHIARNLGKPAVIVRNDRWEEANGISVMVAREKICGARFILSMCDHLFDPSIVKGLIEAPRGNTDCATYLACDFRLDNADVDLEDVTRVRLTDGDITAIGKGIKDYQAYDCGLFNAHISLIEAIENSSKMGRKSLSHGMEVLALDRQCKPFDIQNWYWLDVDDPNAFRKAQASLSTLIDC